MRGLQEGKAEGHGEGSSEKTEFFLSSSLLHQNSQIPSQSAAVITPPIWSAFFLLLDCGVSISVLVDCQQGEH